MGSSYTGSISSLDFLTGSSRNGEPVRLCEVEEDAEGMGSEQEEVNAMLVSYGDADVSVTYVDVEYS